MIEPPRPVVMKFGGSSVADFDRMRRVAQIIAATASERPTVVVVSAMGKTTDRLVTDARALCEPPAPRELDMLLTTGERTSMALLALALHGLGHTAISLTGSQCGVITDHQHGRARIIEVRPFRILDELAAGHVVVVGGFQGVSYKREVTTLGRGGSDTSAVALAAALGADCEIYSDVDGVYDGDPRHVDAAARLEELGYEQMQALSRAGAKVLHARAVELAAERGIAIYARASFPEPGKSGQTVIRNNPAAPTGVRAVTCERQVIELRLRLRLNPGAPASKLVTALGRGLGGLGLAYLQIDERGVSGLLFASQRDDVETLESQVGRIVDQLEQPTASAGLELIEYRGDLAALTLVGAGLEERHDAITQALGVLEAANIALRGIRTDGQSVALLIDRAHATLATQQVHHAMLRSNSCRTP
ncbi:Aspartokinase [Enhygromyxa salina]|uniref:Aspartokinase n=1 Tax=Enhygromyxa salina TaxID=215803 RepID=A0A0C1Z997_9BACT|nr:aspartate kinase [Enhygromyxa salina]KIG14159.1 Aspartokinase [Enhygromyxa salina]